MYCCEFSLQILKWLIFQLLPRRGAFSIINFVEHNWKRTQSSHRFTAMRLGAWRWTDPQYTYLAPHNTPCPPAGSTVPTPPPFTHPSLPQHATGMHIHTKNQSCTTIYLYGLDVRIGVRHSRLEQLVLTHTPSLHRRCQKRSTILTMWWNGVAGAWEFNFLWIWKTGIACAGGGGL